MEVVSRSYLKANGCCRSLAVCRCFIVLNIQIPKHATQSFKTAVACDSLCDRVDRRHSGRGYLFDMVASSIRHDRLQHWLRNAAMQAVKMPGMTKTLLAMLLTMNLPPVQQPVRWSYRSRQE